MFNLMANNDSLSVFDKTVNKICPKIYPESMHTFNEIQKIL